MVCDGFYEPVGDFPEIVEKGDFPTLGQLRHVQSFESDPREVGSSCSSTSAAPTMHSSCSLCSGLQQVMPLPYCIQQSLSGQRSDSRPGSSSFECMAVSSSCSSSGSTLWQYINSGGTRMPCAVLAQCFAL